MSNAVTEAVIAAMADPAVVKTLLARHGLQPRHSLGQNFIVKPEPIIAAISAASLAKSDTVLEIGAGLGTLTRALAECSGRVCAIELDRAFQPVLAETVGACDNVELVFGDARSLDLAALVAPAQGNTAKAVANLPYYATSELLERLILCPARFECIVILVQAEAAARITAGPGEAGYGPLSLLAECFYQSELVLRVTRDCFWPQPKVDSALLALRRRPCAPTAEAIGPLYALIRAAFGQRRKTIAAALTHNRGGVGGLSALPRAAVAQALAEAGLPASARAEQLGLTDFMRLLTALGSQVTRR